MSRYVTILASVECPRCGYEGDFTCFFYRNLGKLNCLEYSIGELVEWERFGSIPKGGRPPGGATKADGWTECPSCKSELVPTVQVVDDVVVAVEISQTCR